MHKEIRLSGFGGQGIGLAGFLLGKALSLYDGKEAVMTQAYGPEARGGASSANVVVSDARVDYPFVQHPDVLVAMSQEAYTKFRPTARTEATIIVDADLVIPDNGDSPLSIPATRLAEELGRRIVANVIMLGYFTRATDIVSREAMERALKETLRPK
ncbi:MAG: 2-oxoacid:acceptor oxidoreductase family protein, partial [Anaerolineae bacterium]